jgi:hypothetical protein
MTKEYVTLYVALISFLFTGNFASSQEDLAQQLSNPLADLVTVPIQSNHDNGLGVNGDGQRTTINLQPVIPFNLDSGATIVTRTIIPLVRQKDVVPGTSQEGVGDISLSAWYSRSNESGVTWGIGPTLLIPTNSAVSGDTWGGGVTAIALKAAGNWTVGGLASQTWSLGKDPTKKIDRTFLQPFVAYDAGQGWTLSASTEGLYDRVTNDWSVPVTLAVSKLTRVGKLPVSWQLGSGYWATSPQGGPEGWRVRLAATVVLPK